MFYPYRKWKLEIPQKRIRPWFFCSTPVAGKKLYLSSDSAWEYVFEDDGQYQSLKYQRGDLAGRAFGLYEKFRTAIPPGVRGWGAKGVLDLAGIRGMAKKG